MAFYTIDFTVTAEGVTPSTPQAAGQFGDHKAALVRFTVPFEGYRYRVEITDGGGGYDTTDLLDADAGVVSYEIPSAWTAAGVATLRLVAVERDEAGNELVRFHSAPAYLCFADREDGAPLGKAARPAWQEALDEARFFLSTVEQKLESGELNGKDGEKGDKGDAGYTPQKGVDYYTDAEKEELVAELGARDVDTELSSSSLKAVSNQAVTAAVTSLEDRHSTLASEFEASRASLHEQDIFLEERLSYVNGSLTARIDGVEESVGDIETALDGIIAIQESLIGGETV